MSVILADAQFIVNMLSTMYLVSTHNLMIRRDKSSCYIAQISMPRTMTISKIDDNNHDERLLEEIMPIANRMIALNLRSYMDRYRLAESEKIEAVAVQYLSKALATTTILLCEDQMWQLHKDISFYLYQIETEDEIVSALTDYQAKLASVLLYLTPHYEQMQWGGGEEPKELKKIRPLLSIDPSKIVFTVTTSPSEFSYKEELKECGFEFVERQLAVGNDWAWCDVTVRGEYLGLSVADHMCGCSYESETDFRNCGYFEDMRNSVIDQLEQKIKALLQELAA